MKKTTVVLFVMAMMVAIIAWALSDYAKADTAFICAVTKGEWVWIRSTPDADGEKIGTLRYGVEGEIHEIVNQYARITTTDGRKGWADVSYLLMPIHEETWIVATKDPLNKRETPDGRYVTKIKGGSRISVLGWRYSKSGELWANVYHGGYVKACYLVKAAQ